MADLFFPKSYPIRKPTDTKQEQGRVVNPPRMMQIGGYDKLHENYGLKSNKMKLRKPGDTV